MSLIINTYTFITEVIFQYPKTRAHFRVRFSLFIILYMIGIAHWVGFFDAGDVSLIAYDWIMQSTYINTLRMAQTNGLIPWRLSDTYYYHTQNFLANPEIILTPDIVLLRWIPNGIFVMIHVMLFYSAGFFGSLLISRKQKSSFIAFLLFWLVFNFNGYLTAHLAVGHFTWTGYFLLPFFFIILSRFVTDSQNAFSVDITSALAMAMLLGLLFLNGSFHIAVWCSMFMVIALLWRWAMFSNVVTSITIGILLGVGRLLPAVLFLPHDRGFISGYPSFGFVLDALTSLRMHNFVESGAGLGILTWWEYDLYIGFIAFSILAIYFTLALKRSKLTHQLPLFAAASIILLLSLGNVYALVTTLPIPFAGIERVSSRFIVMPFMLFLITAMIGIDESFRSWPKNSKIVALIALPFIARDLVLHSFFWRVEFIEHSFQNIEIPETVISLAPISDQVYVLSVYVGWSISLISLLVVVALFFRNNRIQRQEFQ